MVSPSSVMICLKSGFAVLKSCSCNIFCPRCSIELTERYLQFINNFKQITGQRGVREVSYCYKNGKGKGKMIPLQARCGPDGG